MGGDTHRKHRGWQSPSVVLVVVRGVGALFGPPDFLLVVAEIGQ